MIHPGEAWSDCVWYDMPPKHLDYDYCIRHNQLWRWGHCQCRHPENADVPALKRDCRALNDAGRCRFQRQMDLLLGY